MTPNLTAWMDNYAARFMQPQGMAQQNLGAGQQVQTFPVPDAGAPAAPAPQTEEIPGDGFGQEGDQSFETLFKAQPKKEQDQQIDQLEETVGDINKAYDQLQQTLGQRPNTKLTRHEKGMLIMEFGLQLLSQSSASRHGGDIGGAVGDAGLATLGSYRNLNASKEAQAKQWDQAQGNLALGRIKDTSSARREAATLTRQNRQDQIAADRAEETARHNQAMEENADARLSNLEGWQRTQVEKGIGAGRPAVGAAGNLTANQKNIDDLKKRGVPEDLAVRLVYRRIADPRKAWQDLYNSLRRAFSNSDDAEAEADRVIGLLYGDDAVKNAGREIVPAAKPSKEPVKISSDEEYEKLPPGQVFIGPDGKRRRKPE